MLSNKSSWENTTKGSKSRRSSHKLPEQSLADFRDLTRKKYLFKIRLIGTVLKYVFIDTGNPKHWHTLLTLVDAPMSTYYYDSDDYNCMKKFVQFIIKLPSHVFTLMKNSQRRNKANRQSDTPLYCQPNITHTPDYQLI